MQLDLSEIVSRPGMKSSLEVAQEGLDDPELVCLEPVEGRVDFLNSADVLLIDGKAATTLELTCVRCLEPYAWPVTIAIEERFPICDVTQPTVEPSEENDFDNTVANVVHIEAGKPILDLDELIRQQLLTEIPLQPVCDESCRGLCSQCGANLNEEACRCAPSTVDSPLAGLAALLGDPSNGDHRDENGE